MTYNLCSLCPRMCRVNRLKHTGFCGCGTEIKAARAALHHWEEPCISGVLGSGTVFFGGCTLKCCYCQNFDISQEGGGISVTIPRLADIFLRLQDQGAHNINLVTATQYLPSILKALDLTKHRLFIPVIYNCGGYERPEIIDALREYVDVYLPDLKYKNPLISERYSKAPDYFKVASQAILEMIRQTGAPQFSQFGTPAKETDAPGQDSGSCRLIKKGVIIRHMVLPGQKKDSIELLQWIHNYLPEDGFLISLMSQYTPLYHSSLFPEINRRITSYEYDKVVDTALDLGLTNGYIQKKSSAKEEYTPPFNLEGIL